MSAQPTDGGPAFPVKRIEAVPYSYRIEDPQATAFGEMRQAVKDVEVTYSGMSLRDYFAAHAPLMVPADSTAAGASQWAACAGIEAPPMEQSHAAWSEFWNVVEARLRYVYADAMLAARAPKPEPTP